MTVDLALTPPGVAGAAPAAGITALLPGDDGVMLGALGQFNSYCHATRRLVAFHTDCVSGTVGAWERVTWEADTPRGTDVQVDVLDGEGRVLIHDVKNGGSLWAVDPISHTTISLRATLTTRDEQVTPALKSWQVEYTFECGP